MKLVRQKLLLHHGRGDKQGKSLRYKLRLVAAEANLTPWRQVKQELRLNWKSDTQFQDVRKETAKSWIVTLVDKQQIWVCSLIGKAFIVRSYHHTKHCAGPVGGKGHVVLILRRALSSVTGSETQSHRPGASTESWKR